MIGLIPLLALLTLLSAIAAAIGKCPVYVPIVLIAVILLLQFWR